MNKPVELQDRVPGPSGILDPQELLDLEDVVRMWLNEYNDEFEGGREGTGMDVEEYADFYAQYLRVAKLYYVFTGKDFLGNHIFVTNYEGRK